MVEMQAITWCVYTVVVSFHTQDINVYQSTVEKSAVVVMMTWKLILS